MHKYYHQSNESSFVRDSILPVIVKTLIPNPTLNLIKPFTATNLNKSDIPFVYYRSCQTHWTHEGVSEFIRQNGTSSDSTCKNTSVSLILIITSTFISTPSSYSIKRAYVSPQQERIRNYEQCDAIIMLNLAPIQYQLCLEPSSCHKLYQSALFIFLTMDEANPLSMPQRYTINRI